MTFDYIKSALLNTRNILVFFAALILFGIASSSFEYLLPASVTDSIPLSGAILTYAAFTAQSVFDKKFRETYNQKKVTVGIQKDQAAMHTESRELRRSLDSIYMQRLSTVLRDTDETVASYTGGEKTGIKQRIAEKSLKLALAYIKLLDVYRKRSQASHGDQITFLARRINTNTSNLKNVRDDSTAEEIRRVIETDEKMIAALKGERKELDKLDARLQYMESTISMLKYNAVSNLESEDLLRSLEAEVDEAAAINAVLTERQEESRGSRRIRL